MLGLWWARLLNFLAAVSGNGAGGGGSFESIATVTAAGGESTLTFSSIPATYKHLQIRWIARGSGNATYIFARANSTNGYTNHALSGSGSSASASGSTGNTYIQMYAAITQSTATAGMFGCGIMDIHDYASTTKNKTFRAIYGLDSNGVTYQNIELGSSLATGFTTSAINALDFRPDTGNFAAGSTFALYGIKG